MSDLISEVDEALRQDKAKAVWEKYGKVFIAGAIALVVLTALYALMSNRQSAQNQKATAELLTAMEAENKITALGTAYENLDGTHAALAGINAAYAMARGGKTVEAGRIFDDIANNTAYESVFKDYARLKAVSLDLNQNSPGFDPQKSLTQLEKIYENDKSPWRFQARLVGALIYSGKLDKNQEAISVLKPLTELTAPVPETLKTRARNLTKVYEVLSSEKVVTPSRETDG